MMRFRHLMMLYLPNQLQKNILVTAILSTKHCVLVTIVIYTVLRVLCRIAHSTRKYNSICWLSFSSLGITPDYADTYWDANYTTYLLLRNKNAISPLQAKLPPFMKKEMEGKGATVNFHLEPFNKIHLYSPYNSFVPNNSITYIYILAAMALLILIIACFTYVNLSTARSLERAREVGVRKVIGALNNQLFWQFRNESVLLSLIAVLLSLFLSALLLPSFNSLSINNSRHSAFFLAIYFILHFCCDHY
jgi:ABC-type transport system, involved in lipoprotein release, permease component